MTEMIHACLVSVIELKHYLLTNTHNAQIEEWKGIDAE